MHTAVGKAGETEVDVVYILNTLGCRSVLLRLGAVTNDGVKMLCRILAFKLVCLFFKLLCLCDQSLLCKRELAVHTGDIVKGGKRL